MFPRIIAGRVNNIVSASRYAYMRHTPPTEVGYKVLSQQLASFGKRVGEGENNQPLGDQAKQSLDQANLSQNVPLINAADLPFPNHIHGFVSA